MPEHAQALDRIGARLERLCGDNLPLQLSHCDLHPANLLWDGTSLALIDLDTCALAPPALDQGSLAASLAAKAIEIGWDPQCIGSLIDALAIAFKDEGASQFDWFIAASLIGERLYRSATRLKSANPGARRALLELAEERLDRLENSHAR
jgi:aminoglycoside/choline kinase family phosphotransferase